MKSAARSAGKSAAQAGKLLRPLHRDLIELLKTLVQTDTTAIPPYGKETAGQVVLQEFLERHKIACELYDTAFLHRSRHPLVHKNRKYAGRKNLAARIRGTGSGKSLLLNGHMDTVPAGFEPWSASPWSGRVKAGRLYGRGSFDMKAGIVAAAGVLCAVEAAGIRLGGDLILESVVDEEWGGGGGTLAARLRGYSADACVVTESTQLDIYRATRGGMVADLVTEAGDPSGYFSRKEVLSPATALGRLLGWVESWSRRRKKVKPSGAYAAFPDPVPVQILAVEANRLDPNVPLSVPLRTTVRIYFQFLPEEDPAQIIRETQISLKEFAAKDPFYRSHKIEWKPVVDPPLLGHELPADHPWTRCMVSSAAKALGKRPALTASPYPCDAFLIQREFNIPTLLFGPRGGGAHNPDEYVEVDSVIKTAEVLLTAALDWCSQPNRS